MPFAQYSRKSSSSSTAKPFDTNKVNKSIENARVRIEDAGYSAADADKRNRLEKFLNLPEKQNAFFDVLEVIGRPLSGVTNAISESTKGGNVGEGFVRGLTGKDRTRGADLVEDLGIESKIGKAVLGTGVDIALDPLTYVPGGILAKGVTVPARGFAKYASKGYKAIESKSPKLEKFRKDVVQPAAQKTKDTLGRAFVPNYKLDETLQGTKDDSILRAKQETENKIRYQTEESAKNIADTARLAGGIDKGTDVGRIAEAPLRQFEDVKGYEMPDGITRTTSRREIVSAANAKKQQVEELGKDIRDYRIDEPNPLNLSVGDKAFRLTPEGKRTKGFRSKEIEEVRDINGTKEYRFKGEMDFVPVKQVRAIGKAAPTEIGSINQAITQTTKDLTKIDNDLRRVYFSSENAELRKLTKKKNQPANIDEVASSRAFEVVGASPKFNLLLKRRDELKKQLDSLRNDVKARKEGNISQINELTDEVTALRESAKNPVMIQREIPRPERELSSDPAVRQAARNLVRSNAEIRQLALDNDIPITEMEGYMTHVLAREERKRRQNMSAVDRGNRGTGSPKKGVVQERTIVGSVEDVNERLRAAGKLKEDENFFEPNAFFASAIGQKRLIEYVHAVNFRRQVLSNSKFAQKFEKGMPVPNNAVVIDTSNYKFMKDADDELSELADEIGGQYVVTKSVKQALDRYQKLTTDEGINGFLKTFDTLQSGWKRLALFSIPYHLRNDVGAKFNNWVGGMPAHEIAKYSALADVDVYNAVIKGSDVPMYTEFRKQGLGSSGLSAVEFARRGQEPEDALRKTIERRSQFDGTLGGRLKAEVKNLKNPLNAFETSKDFGDFIDQTNRFALFKWFADKNKGNFVTEKELYEAAAKKVREVQFDYSNMTPFESEFATRAIPFYRWMRNNIPFQLKQFANDPRKYMAANKIRMNAQEAVGLDEEELPDWMKDQFAVPVTGDGNKGKFVSLNLPLGDLSKISNPLKMGVDSLSPLLKTPLEVGMNRNFFFDKPIEKFEGQQKQYSVPSNILGLDIPGGGTKMGGIDSTLAYILESLGGQPVRQTSNFFTRPTDADQDNKFRDPGLGISSIVKDYDAEKARYFQAQEELRKLQDLINFIEQQTGEKPRKINEINR